VLNTTSRLKYQKYPTCALRVNIVLVEVGGDDDSSSGTSGSSYVPFVLPPLPPRLPPPPPPRLPRPLPRSDVEGELAVAAVVDLAAAAIFAVAAADGMYGAAETDADCIVVVGVAILIAVEAAAGATRG
jgi:hypothetical protein